MGGGEPSRGTPSLLVLGIIHVFGVARAFATAGCLLFCRISLDCAEHSFQDWVWFLFFFFRPAPLWLSPGRRTLLCWLNELANAFIISLFGGSKVEQRSLRSNASSRTKQPTKTQKHAKHPNKKPNKTTTKRKEGTWHDGSNQLRHPVPAN